MTELEDLWRGKTDEELANARNQMWEYTNEARQVILSELTRRGMSPIPDVAAGNGEGAEELDDVPDEVADEVLDEVSNPITCPRCETSLDFVGSRRFHEGTNWGILGELGELFVNKQSFDVYVCPRCGRVEFFIDGIGEEFRPH